MASYRYVIVEVIAAPHESSRHKVRARPLFGQGFSADIRIECLTSIRKVENVGQLFKVWAKEKDTAHKAQLYTSYHWVPKLASPEEAAAFIKSKAWR